MKNTFFICSLFCPVAAYAESIALTASGTMVIAAPTAVEDSANGIWFIDPSSGAFSLSLPELPSDMVYEGWIVNTENRKKLSTGLFRASGGIDSDAAGLFAGAKKLDFPKVPGSDFVASRIDITDGKHKFVLTIEPYPDMDPNPSAIPVLSGMIPLQAAKGTVITLQNVAN